jgi:CIC family chloride channel protein
MGVTGRGAALYRRAYDAWIAAKQRFAPTERQRLFGLTIAIGGACGLAAVGFHLAIDAVEQRAIAPAIAAPGYHWIWLVILIPTLGALAAGLFLEFAAPQARGSGIPQVKVAYATKSGYVRMRDAIAKFAIGALQIGSGSSLGREGPTVQICAGVATGLGKLAGVSQPNVKRMMPVGAAAGIAAAFNAPIAAVTFTIEEIVGTLDQTLLSGVIVAAALAAVVERSVLGVDPVFTVATSHGLDSASSLVLYAALGVAAALVSVAFTSSLLELRRRFSRTRRIPRWAQPAIGGLVTGVLAVVALAAFHAPGITGGGYALLDGALAGDLVVKALLAICALKLVATVWSYGSGGAGGIFAPSLCIGGMLGGAIGYLDVALFDHPHAVVGSFALVGMGAVFAGTIRAPITSVLIIIEMTNGYSLILPLMIANMSAYGLARSLRPTPIYEALLEQDGVHLAPQTSDGAIDALAVGEFPALDRDFVRFTPALHGGALVRSSAAAGRQEVFPVVDAADHLVGIITIEELAILAAEPQLQSGLVTARDIMRAPIAIGDAETVRAAFELLRSSGVRELPVVDSEQRVVGLVDEVAIAHAYLDARRKQDGTPRGRARDQV